jgi:hypothetical protein
MLKLILWLLFFGLNIVNADEIAPKDQLLKNVEDLKSQQGIALDVSRCDASIGPLCLKLSQILLSGYNIFKVKKSYTNNFEKYRILRGFEKSDLNSIKETIVSYHRETGLTLFINRSLKRTDIVLPTAVIEPELLGSKTPYDFIRSIEFLSYNDEDGFYYSLY